MNASHAKRLFPSKLLGELRNFYAPAEEDDGHGGEVASDKNILMRESLRFSAKVRAHLQVIWQTAARRDSAEDFGRLDALLFTATAGILIPAYCVAIP